MSRTTSRALIASADDTTRRQGRGADGGIQLAKGDLATAAPFAMIGAASLGLAAVAAEVPALAPVGVVTGAAIAIGLFQLRRRPVLAIGLVLPSVLLGVAIASGALDPMSSVALAALTAGCLAGHPAVFALVLLTGLPVFLVGWGIPPVYLAGWVYSAMLRLGSGTRGARERH